MASRIVSHKARAVSLSALLFGFSLFLTAYSSRNPEVGRIGSAIVTTLLSPVQRASTAVTGYVRWVWRSYLDLVDVQKENVALVEELDRRRADAIRLRELEFENHELKQLLEFKKKRDVKGVVAQVIGFETSTWVHAITVDKGLLDGITVGMPVVKESGVVGQVIATGPRHSQVLLVIDHASSVDAFVQRTRARGMIVGRGADKCLLDLVTKDEDVQSGDKVITSGVDGVYPKGLLVGTITKVKKRTPRLFQDIELQTAVTLRRLETVYILQVERE